MMDSASETFCPHFSLPVETDESMTSWPTCEECSVCADDITAPRNDIMGTERLRGSNMHTAAPPLATPTDPGESRPPVEDLRPGDAAVFPLAAYAAQRHWNVPSEDEESLELPLPLRSDVGNRSRRMPPLGLTHTHPQCFRCPPLPARPQHAGVGPVDTPRHTARVSDTQEVMSEVYVVSSQPIGTGRFPAQEVRRTISLPEDCRTVFITYSVDVAEEMFPFVTFLISQGFRPAIDIFDNAVRQMDFNKWMDSYLKNKSVLIIMIISPKYKSDIEGDGADQHGLHTKYIHSQLQNEFILQHCLNFRLVPVLFPTANRSHVPLWLQSTCVYRWPNDAQNLLLRLLREERFIPPPRRGDPTISIRPV